MVRDDLLIEIQTANFAAMKSKITKLIDQHKVRIVHPIAREKWLLKTDGENHEVIISRRKSPKKGHIETIFLEMVSFPQLMMHPNFSLDVLMTQEEVVCDFRRKRWRNRERRLLDVVEQHRFETLTDWQCLIPENLQRFTTKQLAESCHIPRRLAQKMAYCLAKGGVVDDIGKVGREKLYERKDLL